MTEELLRRLLSRKEEGKPIKYCIICDIDNVVVDSREWFKHVPLTNSREEWDEYQSLINVCSKPNKHMIDILASIIDLIPVLFVTSREDRGEHIPETIKQLKEYSDNKFQIGENCLIYYRKEFDYRPSDVVKKDLLDDILDNTVYLPLVAVDDCRENCDMFKAAGVETLWYDIDNLKLETC